MCTECHFWYAEDIVSMEMSCARNSCFCGILTISPKFTFHEADTLVQDQILAKILTVLLELLEWLLILRRVGMR